MKYQIEVKRIRFSVTQGEAAVYINGDLIEQYGDKIEFIDGEYKSSVSDEIFISAALKKLFKK